MRATKIRIKKCKWAKSDGSRWMILGLRNELGGVTKRFFPSKEAAEEWLRTRRPEIVTQGRNAMSLGDAQRVDALRALAILAPHGATLTEAARIFAERARLLERTVTFSALSDEVVAAKKADGAAEPYLKDLKNRLAAFASPFGQRQVSTIEQSEIDDWLRGLRLSPVSRNNYRRNLGVAFSYAVKRGYAQANPVLATTEAKVVPKAPGILRPYEFRALLENADAELVPSIAIAGFAGLREAEVSRLKWSDLDLGEGYVRVEAMAAKTASRRVVEMVPALRAWLSPYNRRTGTVHAPKYHQKLRLP